MVLAGKIEEISDVIDFHAIWRWDVEILSGEHLVSGYWGFTIQRWTLTVRSLTGFKGPVESPEASPLELGKQKSREQHQIHVQTGEEQFSDHFPYVFTGFPMFNPHVFTGFPIFPTKFPTESILKVIFQAADGSLHRYVPAQEGSRVGWHLPLII